MATDIWYSIRKNRMTGGCLKGIIVDDDGGFTLDPNTADHSLFLRALDGVDDDSKWGRVNCQMLLPEEMVCYIYIMTTNTRTVREEDGKPVTIDDILCDPDMDSYDKVSFLTRLGAKRFVNTDDFLLYEFEGRYLYLAMEFLGPGEASVKKLRVSAVGDNFMSTFPEVYQERNSFFHRYMSIFSTIYNDIGDQNENLYEMLDLDKCSADLLEMYGSWFGIDLKGGFLSEDILRQIVKEAYMLNKMKGTRKALERILEIILGKDVILVENRMQGGGIYEVTVMISRRLDENLRHQITFLLNQFKPLRTQIRMIQMEKDAVMDGNSYLDMNASIPTEKHVVLDEESLYEGAITLI